MTGPLEAFRRAGVLSPLDVRFAEALCRLVGTASPAALLGAALACRAPSHGHVCLTLSRLASSVRLERDLEAEALAWPAGGEVAAALQAHGLVGSDPDARRPLVIEDDRLYLHRYWACEERLVAALRARLAATPPDLDPGALRRTLEGLFPPEPEAGFDLQKLAAAMGALRCLTVVSGGPGTGKTTTVVRILAALVQAARLALKPPPRILLVAPTGKAAARLSESIRAQLDPNAARPLALHEEDRRAIPSEAATIHRALGANPSRPGVFRFGPEDPLAVDVVVVDEASMIDLALMTALVEAVPPTARLILLGDRDQLASVEAGAVLGDLCPDGPTRFSSGFSSRLEAVLGPLPPELRAPPDLPVPAIRDAVVQLTRSRRFDPDRGIGALARAINAGDERATLAALAAGDGVERPPEPRDGLDAVLAEAVAAYAPLSSCADPAAGLEALGRFRVLCAHRRGPRGVEGLNERVRELLAAGGHVDPRRLWYPGRPVLVGTNDHGLRLYNGDVGLAAAGAPQEDLRVWFPAADHGTEPRALAPGRLPEHDTVYAMTVHRSQGSEFERVLLILPERPSPLLTRELLYTAVTRARSGVVVVGSAEVIARGVRERIHRASGLRVKLWGG